MTDDSGSSLLGSVIKHANTTQPFPAATKFSSSCLCNPSSSSLLVLLELLFRSLVSLLLAFVLPIARISSRNESVCLTIHWHSHFNHDMELPDCNTTLISVNILHISEPSIMFAKVVKQKSAQS